MEAVAAVITDNSSNTISSKTLRIAIAAVQTKII